MFKLAPSRIGRARVVCWSPVDHRHAPTGGCRQIVAGRIQGPAAGVAIVQYPSETAYYLFGCDADGNAVTDTWHDTLDDAKRQAEFEYRGVSATWELPE